MLVYIHGGYWRALDKRDASFVAPPFVAAGALVVVPNYALCPAASIDEIVRQQRAALAWVWRHAAAHGGDPERIVVAGHSAGGHLAATMLATDWPGVDPGLPADLVKGALSLSGVFELEPLRHAPFLAPDLQLDAAAAEAPQPGRPAGAEAAAVRARRRRRERGVPAPERAHRRGVGHRPRCRSAKRCPAATT